MTDPDLEDYEFPDDVQWTMTRIRLAQLFGWTLSYIDDLSQADVRDIWALLAAQKKVSKDADWWRT